MSATAPIEPAQRDKKCYIGLPWVWRLRYSPGGVQANLSSGYTAKMTISVGRGLGSAVIRTLTSTAGDITLSSASGEWNMVISMSDAVTSAFTENPSAWYMLKLTEGVNDIPLIAGRFPIVYLGSGV